LSPEATAKLQRNWHSNETTKLYLALTRERQEESLSFSFPLKNEKKKLQEALTLATPLEVYERSTLMEVEIKTGRKHQIRRHFARNAMHIIGDRMYGKGGINNLYRERYGVQRIFLHAHKLAFIHPFNGEKLELDCPLPPDLRIALEKLRQGGRA
ncbi:MAG: pseudouridine synthase, partial [Bacteriovoracaceae bacterium]